MNTNEEGGKKPEDEYDEDAQEGGVGCAHQWFGILGWLTFTQYLHGPKIEQYLSIWWKYMLNTLKQSINIPIQETEMRCLHWKDCFDKARSDGKLSRGESSCSEFAGMKMMRERDCICKGLGIIKDWRE